MNFSKPVSYAIRALIYLAEHKADGPILSSTIAEIEAIPAPYLVKILGTLSSARIIVSARGRGGGFELNADPSKIRMFDIVSILEGEAQTKECLLGLGKCGDQEACPIHQEWKQTKIMVTQFLEQTTIAKLMLVMPEVRKKQRKKAKAQTS